MESLMINRYAYKGFDIDENNNLTCQGMVFKVGEISEISGTLDLHKNGIRFFWNICDIYDYQDCLKDKKICRIEILGDVIVRQDLRKSCTNKLKIVEILTKEQEVDLMNMAEDNTGIRNSGNGNSGDRNSGYWNSGDCNSGDWNSGDWNSGDCNSGDCNSGDCNSGDFNSGMFNTCNYSNGIFCNESPKMQAFNVPTDMTNEEFINSIYWNAIFSEPFTLTEWVYYTEEQKKEDKSKDLIGGYLKTRDYKEACIDWWSRLTERNKEIIKSIPNFDADIFFDITGIRVGVDNA